MRSTFGSKLAAADFDNDQRPDGALLRDDGIVSGQKMYRVELHLSAGQNRNLSFAANDLALTVSAQDVNQDGSTDLIVEQAFTHKRVGVWLNDGHGYFSRVRVEDFPGSTDAPLHLYKPNPGEAHLIIGLPSRFEMHHAAQRLYILRFASSSTRRRVRGEESLPNQILSVSISPRAPPLALPL